MEKIWEKLGFIQRDITKKNKVGAVVKWNDFVNDLGGGGVHNYILCIIF